MKTFVLFALTLCVAHGEMSRQLFREGGQRAKSKLDQGSHHGRGVAGTGILFWQSFRKKFGHYKAIPVSRSFSRVAGSGSGYGTYVVGNRVSIDLVFGSGFSSGFGSGSSLPLPIWLNDGIQAEESQTKNKNKKMHNPPAQTPTHDIRNSSSSISSSSISSSSSSSSSNSSSSSSSSSSSKGSNPNESSDSNMGIIRVLTPPNHQVNGSIFGFFTGSGDTGSGSSSGEVNHFLFLSSDVPVSDVQESSGSDMIEEVIIKPNVAQRQYAQGRAESVGTSTGSGSIACIGDISCVQGSGNIEIYDAQIPATEKPANSSVQQDSVPGEQLLSSGMYAVDHQP